MPSTHSPAATHPAAVRVLYVFGGSVAIDDQQVVADTGVVVDPTQPVPLVAGDGGAEILMLQGRPIAEPVAKYGPFVMNSQAEIAQARTDFNNGKFGQMR